MTKKLADGPFPRNETMKDVLAVYKKLPKTSGKSIKISGAARSRH